MKSVLVTGAAGFIGFFTMQRLLKEGYTAVGLDNINNYYDVNLKYARLKELGFNKSDTEQWNKEVQSNTNEKAIFIRLNLEDRENLPKLFEKHQFDAVIHLAAQAGVRYSLENPMAYVDSNLVGFVNILECYRHHIIKHFLYASNSYMYRENLKIPFSEEVRVDYYVSLYAATTKPNQIMTHTYSHVYQLP